MNHLLSLLLRLTICGGAVSLLLLLARPGLKHVPARWRRFAAAASLVFFLVPFQLPLPLDRFSHSPEMSWPPAEPGPGAFSESVKAPPEYIDGEMLAADHRAMLSRYLLSASLILWLGGAAALTLYRWANWRRFSAGVLAGCKQPAERLLHFYKDLCGELGIRHPPELLYCGCVGAPMLMGAFRPRLLLPELPLEQALLDLILRHELTHYQSNDTRLKLAALAVSLLHWWNPLAYLPGRLLQTDCELACDERMTRSMDGEQRKLYSITILDLMSCVKTPLAASFSRKRQVKGRLKAILRASPPSRSARMVGAASAVALILCGVAASSLLAFAMGPSESESATTADYLPNAYPTQHPAPSGSDSSLASGSEEAEAVEPRLIRQLLDSVSLTSGEVRFTIPAETPPLGKKWFIHISGRSPAGLSLHWLEQESDGFLWELGKTYRFPLDPAAFLGDGETVDAQGVIDLCKIDIKLVQLNPENGRMIESAGGGVWPVSQWVSQQGKRYTDMDAPTEETKPEPPFPAGSPDKNPNPGVLVIETPLSAPLEAGEKVADYADFAGHAGVDYNAPKGNGVLAAAGGIVTAVVDTGDGSQTIVAAHGNGLETIYSLCGNITVKPGDSVERGQKMAEIDRTGEWAPHLHFEVHLDGEPVDPTPYLARG